MRLPAPPHRLRVAAAAIAAAAAVAAGAALAPPRAAAAPAAAPAPRTEAVTVDGVRLSVTAAGLPPGGFTATPAGTAVQAATAAAAAPFTALSVAAVPFGDDDPGEAGLGTAAHGRAAAWLAALGAFRRGQGAAGEPPVTASVFGAAARGIAHRVMLALDGLDPVPVDIDEWVVEGGPRLWLLRAEHAAAPGGFDPRLVVSAADLGAHTTVGAAPAAPRPGGRAPAETSLPPGAPPLPAPPWWDGFCDEHRDAGNYQLGTTEFRGVPACGPTRAARHGGAEPIVEIGSWGEYEWECVELVMRYMFAAGYITSAYHANGNTVVADYPGSRLVRERNGVPGVAPQPGDVLSMALDTTYGHTALVIASRVDAHGDGQVEVLQENWDSTGVGTLAVHAWNVAPEGGYGTGVVWLHDPAGAAATATPAPSPRPKPAPQPPPSPPATSSLTLGAARPAAAR